MKRLVSVLSVAIIVLAACAPGATGSVDTEAILAALAAPCVNDPPPVVAVIEFENTTSRFGTTVTGVEAAATARLIHPAQGERVLHGGGAERAAGSYSGLHIP